MPGSRARRALFAPMTALAFASALSTSPPAVAQPGPGPAPCFNSNQIGCWGPVLQWQIEAIHGILLRTGKVLIIDPSNPNQCRLFDPITDTVGPIFSAPANHWLFCAGHSQMPDGRILFAGGIGAGVAGTSIYDPVAISPWSTPDAPPAQRFYPTCTTLGNGEVLVMAGEVGDPNANTPNTFAGRAKAGFQWDELRDATYCDQSLSCAPPIYPFHIPFYPFMFQLSSGHVLYCGSEEAPYNQSSPFSRLFNPVAETWTDLFFAADPIAGGSAAHYRPDRVMKAGGHGPTFNPTNEVYTLDMTSPAPFWVQQPSMGFARDDFYLVCLADGTVLSIGGYDQTFNPVMNPELFDPDAPQSGWRRMAPMTDPRQYHSSALLLPDARVVIGGGGLTTAQVYWPPYLFDSLGQLAQRPAIIAAGARGIVPFGRSFAITTNDALEIKQVNLVRLGAATHSFDHDQRFIPLEFAADVGQLKVAAPETPYDAPAGYYMLFIVNDRGVPSVATIVKLQDCT